VHRRGHSRLDPAVLEEPRRVLVLLVVLGDDQPALGHGAPGDAVVPRGADAAQLERVAAAHGHQLEHGRIVGRDELKAGDLVAEQLAGAEADRVEHVLAHRAVCDRALDAGQPLEQLLALLERVQQALVQLRLGLGLVPLTALLGGEPEHPQRQRQHVRHAAREVDLVGREVTQAVAGEHEPRQGLGLDGDRQRRTVLDARGDQAAGVTLGDVGQRGLDHRVAPEPDGGHDLAAAQQRGDLGPERLGGPLDRDPAGGALVLRGRDHREKAGQLLDRPVARRAGQRRCVSLG
jgi:hypothetical protein